MPRSERYKLLQKELSSLRKHLLPNRFSSTGVYRDSVYTKAFAYRVLAHAEFESYLEDRVTHLYRKALSSYRHNSKALKVIAALLAFSGLTMEQPPDTAAAPKPNQNQIWDDKIKLEKKITAAGNSFYHVIHKNHGIKEKNILSLLLPVGVECDEIDDFWLSTINSFGEERGLAAHSSMASKRTTQLPDPKNELNRVIFLLNGFKDIDEILNRLQF